MYGSLMIHVGHVFGEIIIVDLRYKPKFMDHILQRQDRLTSFYVMIYQTKGMPMQVCDWVNIKH